ncbi:hypothetical protein BJ944DRAFT_165485 [Cunninghamella echinulata]|nr:hypothetical protein BJ944DRAFT_165485 [Cunninghamella echinulata]
MPATIIAPSSKEQINNNNNNKDNDINLVLSNYDIDKLTNIDDIRECLRLLDDEETHIDQSLDQMLSQEVELQTALGTLDILRPQLGNLRLESSKMIETINNTAKLAANISDKVRQLDKEHARTRQAISYVDDVQELKYCVSGIQDAMQRKEYDEAANLLQRSSRINTSIMQGSLAEFTVVRNNK